MIASHGGRYITKAGSHRFPEKPHWRPDRVVIIEFPDMERLNDWYTSAEYQPLIKMRQESTDEKDMVSSSRVLDGARLQAFASRSVIGCA